MNELLPTEDVTFPSAAPTFRRQVGRKAGASTTRRHWMHAATAAGLGHALGGCRKQPAGPATLRLLIWNDYISPQVLKSFEEVHQCTVTTQTYRSNQELHEMLENPDFEADVAVPSSYYLDVLVRAGLIASLDHDALPALRHLDQGFIERSGLKAALGRGVPYFVAPTGIALASGSGFQADAVSWSVFDEARQASLLPDMVEVLGAAILASGGSKITWDAAQLALAQERAERWLRRCEQDGDTYAAKLRLGRLQASHAYPGDVLQMQGGGNELSFGLPREGFIVTCDMLAVTSMAANVGLAHRFINFLCQPAECAANMEWTMYRAPNHAAFDLARPKLPDHISLRFLDAPGLSGQIIPPLTETARQSLLKTWAAVENSK